MVPINRDGVGTISMLWRKHEYYERINRGVHRKASNRVGAPALVWHLGLWLRSGIEDGQKQSPLLPQDYTVTNQYVNGLRDHLSVQSDSITFDDYGALKTNITGVQTAKRGNIASFKFRWNGIFTTVRVEIHSEYISLTSLLDASVLIPSGDERTFRQAFGGRRVFRDIESAFLNLNEGVSGNKSGIDYESINDTLYKHIWGTFENEVLFYDPSLALQLGKVFADFRGVITSEPYPTIHNGIVPILQKKTSTFDRPFRGPHRKRPSNHRNDFPSRDDGSKPGWARSRVVSFWPFVECNERFSDVEFTVSEFLKGRAIYISSLGPNPDDSRLTTETDYNYDPILFCLHTYSDDPWQIGRLVDRLLQAGTARLAAVIELDALHDAERDMSQLEAKILEARAEIHDALKIIAKGRSVSSAIQNKIGTLFNEAQELFANLNANFINQSIEYRAERSVYYIDHFKIARDSLRIERLEGYQPYDEYVERRLGGSFSFIRMMQHRVLEAKEDMTSLYQYFVSENITNIAAAIKKRDESIQEIQDFGEIILLVGLLPYYLAYQFVNNSVRAGEAIYWHLAFVAGGLIALARFGRNLWQEWKERRAMRFTDTVTAVWSAKRLTVVCGAVLLAVTCLMIASVAHDLLHPASRANVTTALHH